LGDHQGKLDLRKNLKIYVLTSDSGGNLAAIVALKARTLTPPISIVSQLLIVPVIDNTASPSGELYTSWEENALTAWLPPARMLWFRNNYLPNAEDRTKWDNSPIFAPDHMFAQAPKAWIAVTEMDILRDEGIAYGKKLQQAGVTVETKVYEKVPHPTMALDGESINYAALKVNQCL
jgi:acetyl esterase/lipase